MRLIITIRDKNNPGIVVMCSWLSTTRFTNLNRVQIDSARVRRAEIAWARMQVHQRRNRS